MTDRHVIQDSLLPHEHETPAERMTRAMRLMAAVFGIAVMAVGLFYAIRLFTVIFETLQNPGSQAEVFHQWARMVADEEGFKVSVQGNTVDLARFFGIAVVGGGLLILTWIAMGMMLIGAKIVSVSLGDLEAIRRILKYTFGPVYARQQARSLTEGDPAPTPPPGSPAGPPGSRH